MSKFISILVSSVLLCLYVSSVSAGPTASNTTGQVANVVSGQVVETMDAGGYTYVGVKIKNGETVWAAGPKTAVSKGQSVSFDKGTEMRDFTSRTLNRTFKTIYFASALRVTGTVGPSKPDTVAAAALKTAVSNPSPQPLPSGGFTVEQLFTQASTLSGKQVTFRGKVVKYNAGIMGKNWMHIQDGTGAAASNTHDITVTTNGSAAVGDFVVVKGMLVTDKDFGAGYRYAVIVENASVTKN